MSSQTLIEFFSLIFAICLLSEDVRCDGPTVVINAGRLSGSIESSFGNSYYSFKGIPYAKPPIDNLRFKPPIPHPGWNDTLQATKHGAHCPQINMMNTDTYEGEEDCLFLNVYTPRLKTSENKPLAVMFWIHGGFFRYGSGNDDFYGPDHFMEEDVVLVTVNYRLGALGFLDLEDEIAPGNMGLKDIILALKWVKENIEEFGGDPERVTIFGNESGGVAVDILVLSPKTKGFFHRAICQSGVSLMSSYLGWGPRERSIKLANKIGSSATDIKEVLKYLKKAKASELVESLPKTIDTDEANLKQFGILPFSASVSKYRKNAILTQFPEEIFESGKIPNPDVALMFGFNSEESILHSMFYIQRPQLLKYLERSFQFLFPLRDLYAVFGSYYYHEIIYRLKDFYFVNGTVDITRESILDEYLTFISDNMMYPIDKTVQAYAKLNKAPVYYYRFSYDGGLNYFKNQSTEQMYDDYPINVDGASQKDELCYLFKCNIIAPSYSTIREDPEEQFDVDMIKKMTRLWANFAKTGNPTPNAEDDILGDIQWKPVTKDQKNFLDIDDVLELAINPNFKSVDFWDSMYEYYDIMAIDGVLPAGKDPPQMKDEL